MSESVKYQCNRCEKTFQTKAAMKKHQKITHGEVTSVRCDICGKDYSGTSARNKHIKVVHNQGDVLAHCKVCKKPFYQKSTLRDHLKNYCEAKPFPCIFPGCKVKVKNNKSLKVHMRIHTVSVINNSTKEVSCPTCGEEFSNKGNYTRHHKTVHLNRSDFRCQICDYKAKAQVTLDNHLESVKHLKKKMNQQKCKVEMKKLQIKA